MWNMLRNFRALLKPLLVSLPAPGLQTMCPADKSNRRRVPWSCNAAQRILLLSEEHLFPSLPFLPSTAKWLRITCLRSCRQCWATLQLPIELPPCKCQLAAEDHGCDTDVDNGWALSTTKRAGWLAAYLYLSLAAPLSLAPSPTHCVGILGVPFDTFEQVHPSRDRCSFGRSKCQLMLVLIELLTQSLIAIVPCCRIRCSTVASTGV